MTATYLMEDPREARRLAEKVDADAWVAAYLAPLVQPRARILDVGCGPGAIAAAAARAFPACEIVAIDASPLRVAAASRALAPHANASVHQGDALALPFADESFDLVLCRFLLQYLAGRARAVAEQVRVCRTGGVIMLQDLDGQLVQHHPPDHELERGLRVVLVELARIGFDPFVGRKLFQLARETDLADVTVRIEPYHLIAGRVGQAERGRWELKLDIARRALTERGIDGAAKVADALLAYLDRDDTLTFSQLFTVAGTKTSIRTSTTQNTCGSTRSPKGVER
jgi:SAM-dependent methyltransferase